MKKQQINPDKFQQAVDEKFEKNIKKIIVRPRLKINFK